MSSATPIRPTPAILTPLIDLLCVGGLSLLILVPLLLSGVETLGFIAIGILAWGQALLNYTHFMASYRIVYRSREMILRHKWASIGVPVILAGGVVAALLEAQGGGRVLLTVFFAVASGYLAWHYTGQVWGMMASYAHLEGVPFDRTERLLVRSGLRLLLAWHVLWFLRTALRDPGPVEALYPVVSAGAILALGLGTVGLWRMRIRTGRIPPGRVLVPWLALFAWYAALARWGLPALFLVQAFHALQYLEFPVRVELNRAVRDAPGHAAGRMVAYALVLAAGCGHRHAGGSGTCDERRRGLAGGGAGKPRARAGDVCDQHPPLLHRWRGLEDQQPGGAPGAVCASRAARLDSRARRVGEAEQAAVAASAPGWGGIRRFRR